VACCHRKTHPGQGENKTVEKKKEKKKQPFWKAARVM